MVKIKPVGYTSSKGSIFDSVFEIISQTEALFLKGAERVDWNFFECCSVLHPFYVAILSLLKYQYGARVSLCNVEEPLRSYLSAISFGLPLEIVQEDKIRDLSTSTPNASYIPACRFSPHNKAADLAQGSVLLSVVSQLESSASAKGVISYLFAELIDNITDHSHSEEGFLFCQYVPEEGMVYIAILDLGRSIYSSYAADNRYRDVLTLSESDGLVMALNGISTKNRPENENRGYGISRSRDMVVKGLGGEFYILSGSALALPVDAQSDGVVIELPDELRWNGTAVFIKIPSVIRSDFNLYDYIS